MTQLSDINSFITETQRIKNLSDLDALLSAIVHDMGFDFYALVQHVDVRRHSGRETIWLENYPDSWAEAFVCRGLYANDPILAASMGTNAGFLWENVGTLIRLTPHHRRVLAEAAREGMGEGFTVPAHLPGESNGTCNFAMKIGRTLPRTSLMMAQLVGTFAFEAARQIIRRQEPHPAEKPKLTQRQLECLIHVARGKSDWETARILGIKESTVRDHVEDACTRYDVRRRVQLVVRAMHDGQLTLHDMIG